MDKEQKRPAMPGGLTRQEFDGLRDDLKMLLSEHPTARFTIVFLDNEGKRTEDHAKAARYGMTVYEEEELLYEEFGQVTGDGP